MLRPANFGSSPPSIRFISETNPTLQWYTQQLPSRELTYPPKMAFWVDDFPNFPRWDMWSFPGGYPKSPSRHSCRTAESAVWPMNSASPGQIWIPSLKLTAKPLKMDGKGDTYWKLSFLWGYVSFRECTQILTPWNFHRNGEFELEYQQCGYSGSTHIQLLSFLWSFNCSCKNWWNKGPRYMKLQESLSYTMTSWWIHLPTLIL